VAGRGILEIKRAARPAAPRPRGLYRADPGRILQTEVFLMNVLLINGSPHANGCTDAALREVAKALNADGIETTIFHIGAAPVAGCIGCGGCAKTGKCVFGGP